MAMLSNGKQKLFATLNNRFASKTSWLEAQAFHDMVGAAYAAVCVEPDAGFLLAFDQSASYDSANFLWFKRREKQFVYIDRIVINSSAQSQGLGGMLYECLFEMAREDGHKHIVCEVNILPENPVSLAFHERMGFEPIEDVTQNNGDKIVRYLKKTL
jgi:hypothetical protein